MNFDLNAMHICKMKLVNDLRAITSNRLNQTVWSGLINPGWYYQFGNQALVQLGWPLADNQIISKFEHKSNAGQMILFLKPTFPTRKFPVRGCVS